MTRRGCGCCNCSPKKVRFDQNYYAPTDTRCYHTRTLSLVEEVQLFVYEYDPATGRQTSYEDRGVIATFQHDPVVQEFALTSRESDILISCNIDVEAYGLVYHEVTERDDQGNRLRRKIYRGVLTATGTHLSKVAIESDFSDAYEFGRENKHGYRTTSNIVISRYSYAGGFTPEQAGLPSIRVQTKFSSDEAPGFSSGVYEVFYRLQNTGVSDSLEHEFSPFNSLDQIPEDIEYFDQSFTDPLDAGEDMGDPHWDEKRPTVQPGLAAPKIDDDGFYTTSNSNRRGYTLVEREPSGPIDGKSYTLIQPKGRGYAARFTGEITSHYVTSYVTPEWDPNRKLFNEFAGEPDKVGSDVRRFAGATQYLYENPVQDFYIDETSDAFDRKRNWRTKGWTRTGYMAFESSKAYKDNTSVHLHELCFDDSFSRTGRDVHFGDDDFRLSVDFIDAITGDVEFSQEFKKDYHSLVEDVDHDYFNTVSGVDYPRGYSPVPGVVSTFKGSIDADFDWLKRFPYANQIDGEPEYVSKYARFQNSRVYKKGGYRTFVFAQDSDLGGVYRVDGTGEMKLLEGVPVSEGGLLHIGGSKPHTYSYILKELRGSDFTETLKTSVSSSQTPSQLVVDIDYVDDVRMHVIGTSGDFGSGICQSLSHSPLDYSGSQWQMHERIPTWSHELARALNEAGIRFDGAYPASAQRGYISAPQFSNWLYTPYRGPGVSQALLDATTSPNHPDAHFFTRTQTGSLGSYPLTIEAVQQMVEDGVVEATIRYPGDVATELTGRTVSGSTPTNVSLMSFRIRDTHIEMGSFRKLSEGGFEDGVQFSHKPLRYSQGILNRDKFEGFRIRFEIEAEDHFPGMISTIGLADPENNNRQGCNDGECSMDPYSVLNYDVEVTSNDGLEHAELTSASYSACSTRFISEPKLGDRGGIEYFNANTKALTAYRPSNAQDLNTHTFGDYHPDFSVEFSGLYYSAYPDIERQRYDGLNRVFVRGFYGTGGWGDLLGQEYDADGYRPYEIYDIQKAAIVCDSIFLPSFELYEFLTTPEATVEVFGGPCDSSCYREHTVEYKQDGEFSVEPGQFGSWRTEANYVEVQMTGPGCSEDSTFSATTEIKIKPHGPNRDYYAPRARDMGVARTLLTQSYVSAGTATGIDNINLFGSDISARVETDTREEENSEGEAEEVEFKKLVVECTVKLPRFQPRQTSLSPVGGRYITTYPVQMLADKDSDHFESSLAQVPEELQRPESLDLGACQLLTDARRCDTYPSAADDDRCRTFASHAAVSFVSGQQGQCPNRPQHDPAGIIYDYYVDNRYYVSATQGEGEMVATCRTLYGRGYDVTFGPPVSVGEPVSTELVAAGESKVVEATLKYNSLEQAIVFVERYLGTEEVELEDDFSPLDPPDVTLEFGGYGYYTNSVVPKQGVDETVELEQCRYFTSQASRNPDLETVENVMIPSYIGYRRERKDYRYSIEEGFQGVASEFTGVTVKLKKRS